MMNADGTALTTFAGYRIAYGNSPTLLQQTAQVSNPTVTTYTIDSLSSGTWYFIVTTYLADSTESAPSNPVSRVVP